MRNGIASFEKSISSGVTLQFAKKIINVEFIFALDFAQILT